jgi:hypothetical protein
VLVHGVVIALVPWLLDSSELIYGRRSRPIPGQDRRGEPLRPVRRRAMPPAGRSSSSKSTQRVSAARQSAVAKLNAEKSASEKPSGGTAPNAKTAQEKSAAGTGKRK